MKVSGLARWVGRLVLALGLLSGGVAAAQTGSTPPSSPAAVLYDQTTNESVSGWATSSNFETSLNKFDSQAADDFVVPNVFWHISTVTAAGLYDGPAGNTYVESILVQIYSDAGTSPSSPAGNFTLSQTIPAGGIGGLTTGLFVFNLNSPLTLGPGHYWLSVQANKPFGADSRQWVWRESANSVPIHSESVWQQPGDGYNKHCPTWKPRVTVCREPTTSQGMDLAFKLEGTTSPVLAQVFLPSIYH